MKITKIKHTNKNKYELIIDEKKHVIYDDVLLAFNIYKPGEITKDLYDKLIEKNNFYEGYYKALNFLNFKMRSNKEVYQKLKTLNISKENIFLIIKKLEEEGYLDNHKYLKAFILDEINLSLDGPKKIIKKLITKGFKEEDILKELSLIDNNLFKENAQKYIEKKLKGKQSGSLERIKLKLKNDLYNLGYEEKYFHDYLDLININEEENKKKDEEKIRKTLSKKYEGDLLEYKIKQKLYALGYKN